MRPAVRARPRRQSSALKARHARALPAAISSATWWGKRGRCPSRSPVTARPAAPLHPWRQGAPASAQPATAVATITRSARAAAAKSSTGSGAGSRQAMARQVGLVLAGFAHRPHHFPRLARPESHTTRAARASAMAIAPCPRRRRRERRCRFAIPRPGPPARIPLAPSRWRTRTQPLQSPRLGQLGTTSGPTVSIGRRRFIGALAQGGGIADHGAALGNLAPLDLRHVACAVAQLHPAFNGHHHLEWHATRRDEQLATTGRRCVVKDRCRIGRRTIFDRASARAPLPGADKSNQPGRAARFMATLLHRRAEAWAACAACSYCTLRVEGLEIHGGQVQRGNPTRVIRSATLARRYGNRWWCGCRAMGLAVPVENCVPRKGRPASPRPERDLVLTRVVTVAVTTTSNCPSATALASTLICVSSARAVRSRGRSAAHAESRSTCPGVDLCRY